MATEVVILGRYVAPSLCIAVLSAQCTPPPTPWHRVSMRETMCWFAHGLRIRIALQGKKDSTALVVTARHYQYSMHSQAAGVVDRWRVHVDEKIQPKPMRTNEQPKERSHTSLLPRPNPLITLPSSRRGNGASGPLSGPAVGSRGPSGLMVVVV